jgi:hypothetical protein
LFPFASEYILVGLERIGSLPDLKLGLFKKEDLEKIKKSLDNFFVRGFFITEYMAKQLSNQKIRIIPLFLTQLSFLGYEVIDLETGDLLSIDSDSSLKVVEAHALKIRFKDNNNMEKTLFYIQYDLDDSRKDSLNSLFFFVADRPFATFIKSASYALHNPRHFSKIRDFILSQSQAILQDDTGVPFSRLQRFCDIQLFGLYTYPALKVFQALYRQDDLALAYEKQKPELLPFLLGYGCTVVPSHLILAFPKATARKSLYEAANSKDP